MTTATSESRRPGPAAQAETHGARGAAPGPGSGARGAADTARARAGTTGAAPAAGAAPTAPVVRLWQPTAFANNSPAQAARVEEERRRALDEGRAAGFRAGIASAAAIVSRLDALVGSAERSLRLMEERLAGEMLDLSIELARQVIRSDVTTNRESILAVAREAIGLVSQEARSVRIVAHPSDAELLRSRLAEEIARNGWTIEADHRIEPGGLRIASSTGDVDATLATRWRRVLAALGQDHPWSRHDGDDLEP